MRTTSWGLVALCLLALAGCNGSEYNTAPVKGKVTFQEQRVTSGQLFFHPMVEPNSERGNNPGKPAFADIDKDGNYQLSTYGVFDGAVIGRHRVSYVPPSSDVPSGDEGESGRKTPRPKPASAAYQVAPDQEELTVVAGDNVFDFKLVPKT